MRFFFGKEIRIRWPKVQHMQVNDSDGDNDVRLRNQGLEHIGVPQVRQKSNAHSIHVTLKWPSSTGENIRSAISLGCQRRCNAKLPILHCTKYEFKDMHTIHKMSRALTFFAWSNVVQVLCNARPRRTSMARHHEQNSSVACAIACQCWNRWVGRRSG